LSQKWRTTESSCSERRREKRIWISYGKIKIEGRWWRWDEYEQTLKDKKGRTWRCQGEGEMIEEER